MKTWLFILAAVLAGVALYIYFDPGLNQWVTHSVKTLLPDQQSTRLYKWRDSQGQTHITAQPPSAGIDYEPVEYRHDTNVLPSEALTGKPKQ
ncbi:MAG: DUF4124 domain-containing protein [Proteobacteria bacterium]|jgi:hypothetical protein|nr:DUF4124 domain-containing protein [Pseudomonadota bacterium]